MTKNIKNRILYFALAIISALAIIQPSSILAVDYSKGGWNQVRVTSTITNASGGAIGSVNAGEGVTQLYSDGNRVYIEYSAGSSFKRGFISKDNLYYSGGYPQTAVGLVKTSSNTYYAPNTSFYAGSVNAGEYVAVLCRPLNSSWAYVEYNVPNGQRKRAYINASNIEYYSSNIARFYQDNNYKIPHPVSSYISVYAGPDGNSYPVIGQIYPSDNGRVYKYVRFHDGNGKYMQYVEYPSGNGIKYGYIYE